MMCPLVEADRAAIVWPSNCVGSTTMIVVSVCRMYVVIKKSIKHGFTSSTCVKLNDLYVCFSGVDSFNPPSFVFMICLSEGVK